jgi:hypothetical protein
MSIQTLQAASNSHGRASQLIPSLMVFLTSRKSVKIERIWTQTGVSLGNDKGPFAMEAFTCQASTFFYYYYTPHEDEKSATTLHFHDVLQY